MPWNGSGAFNRLHGSTGWTDDKNSAIFILSSRHDDHDNDMATGVGLAITKDNQSKPASDFKPNLDNAYDGGSIALTWKNWYVRTMRLVNSGFYSAFTPATLTANRTITIPDQSATLLLTTGGYSFTAARQSTNQTLPLSTTTDVVFNNVYTNLNGGMSAVTGIYTAPATGFYFFHALLRLQNNTVSAAVLNTVFFSKNGGTSFFSGNICMLGGFTEGATINAASNTFDLNGSWGLLLTAGDTIRVKVNVGAGANLTLNQDSFFSGSLVAS